MSPHVQAPALEAAVPNSTTAATLPSSAAEVADLHSEPVVVVYLLHPRHPLQHRRLHRALLPRLRPLLVALGYLLRLRLLGLHLHRHLRPLQRGRSALMDAVAVQSVLDVKDQILETAALNTATVEANRNTVERSSVVNLNGDTAILNDRYV